MKHNELMHLKKIIDAQTTYYGILRDKYSSLARNMDLFILMLSAIMCATIFMDVNIFVKFNINPDISNMILGLASLFVFILSIWQNNVEWKQKSNIYMKAFDDVIMLKAKLREMEKFGCDDDVDSIRTLCSQITIDLAKLPPIPDKKFPALKSAHKRKIAMSKYIDECSGMPYIIIWLRFNLRIIFQRKKIKDVIN